MFRAYSSNFDNKKTVFGIKQLYRLFTALFFVIFLNLGTAWANVPINIVYPAKSPVTINAKSTFFVGNTNPKATLKINGEDVKVYKNGGFVYVVNLVEGEKDFLFEAAIENDKSSLDYKINCPFKKYYTNVEKPLISGSSICEISLLGSVKKDISILRATPDGDRLTPLPKNTKVIVTGSKGDCYRISLGENRHGWLKKDEVEIIENTQPCQATFKELRVSSHKDFTEVRIAFNNTSTFEICQDTSPKMKITFYDVTISPNTLKTCFKDNFLKEVKLSQPCEKTLEIEITPKTKTFWGYKYSWDGNEFVLKLKKQPSVKSKKPLKGKIIAIDAGHGGEEAGSIGPTRVPEKEINLAIAKYLRDELEKAGAKVIMTRESDIKVPIFDRPKIAAKNNADILISVHNNALPDGQNPYEVHGTTTYYYHPQSLALAKSVQKSMIQELELKDLGVKCGSLVLTRPTEQPSILVEVAFMIHPEEYMLLTTEEFQKKSAKAVKDGIEEFFRDF